MAKKALICTILPDGKDGNGYKVLEVVDPANTFETHPTLQWKDCSDEVEMDKHWYDPSTETFKKLPEAIDQGPTGELAVDEEGNPTEDYEWDWDNESWIKVTL